MAVEDGRRTQERYSDVKDAVVQFHLINSKRTPYRQRHVIRSVMIQYHHNVSI